MQRISFKIVGEWAWFSLGIALICIFAIANLKFGAIHYTWQEICNALLLQDTSSILYITLTQVRFPMIIMAIMAGAALAISGLLLQRVTQNPLACPSLSGVEYGTAFCVILCYMLLPDVAKPFIIVIALLGGLLTYSLTQIIVRKTSATPASITLIGVAFDAFYFSAIQAILLAFPYQAQAILYDLNGSLQGITLLDIQWIFIPLILCFFLVFLLAKRLDLLDLDEAQAISIGMNIKQYRLILLALSIFLATLVTSMIGPLLFFSLIIPHIVRPIAKSGSSLLMMSAIYGAVFLLFAQFITQFMAPETPPPVGLVMLLIAAPMLTWIVRRYLSYDAS